jgi:MSHA biogenesis protein MshQ
LTSRIAAAPGGPVLTWSAGAANVTARLVINRNAAGTRDGPFDGIAMSGARIGIAPVDPDGVAVAPAALDLDTDGNASLDHVQIGTMRLRFGQLRLTNAHGSASSLIPVRLETQYWNGTAFVKNTDDSCTPVAASNVALGNYQKNLSAGETTVTVSAARVSSGEAWLRLSAPGASNNGSVDVSVNLTSGAAGQSCTGGMGASTGASLSYLQGAWCGAASTRDPTARATFGVYRNASTIVYQRENY